MDRRRFLQGLLAAGIVTIVQPTLPVSLVAPTLKVDFEQLATTTLNHYRKILADSITTHKPTYYWMLKRNGDIKVIPDISTFEPLIRE